MEVTFQNQGCPCLKPVLRQVRNAEQSQEIRLTEGMPDVGRILTACAVRSGEATACPLPAG